MDEGTLFKDLPLLDSVLPEVDSLVGVRSNEDGSYSDYRFPVGLQTNTSSLPTADLLDGSEYIEVLQDGVKKKITIAALASFLRTTPTIPQSGFPYSLPSSF